MRDQFGRDIHYLRLSLTQRCNMRCMYCIGQDLQRATLKDELSLIEIERLIAALTKLGFSRVRLTGGEPLIRHDVVEIVRTIKQHPQITDLSLTTNGALLAPIAWDLKQAGLDRVNISLDSLNAETFFEMTGGNLQAVLDGIDASLAVGFDPVKINVVLLKGRNDDEVKDFIQMTRDLPVDVRFIELMPIANGRMPAMQGIDNQAIIAAHPELVPIAPRNISQPSEDYQVAGYKGRVGFISALSHQFCRDCNRVRVMSNGRLRPCLVKVGEVDLRPLLASDEDTLLGALQQLVTQKPAQHDLLHAPVTTSSMKSIGG